MLLTHCLYFWDRNKQKGLASIVTGDRGLYQIMDSKGAWGTLVPYRITNLGLNAG